MFAAGIDNLDAAGQSATDKLTRESKFRISIVADNNLVMKGDGVPTALADDQNCGEGRGP